MQTRDGLVHRILRSYNCQVAKLDFRSSITVEFIRFIPT